MTSRQLAQAAFGSLDSIHDLATKPVHDLDAFKREVEDLCRKLGADGEEGE